MGGLVWFGWNNILSYSQLSLRRKLGHAEFLLLAQSKHDGDVASHELQNRVGEEGSDRTAERKCQRDGSCEVGVDATNIVRPLGPWPEVYPRA